MCRHLTDPAALSVEYVRVLTGRGLHFNLCCTACGKAQEAGQAVELVEACEGCVARYDEDDDGVFIAWRGRPSISERPEPLDRAVAETALPDELGSVLDIAPIADEQRSSWLLLIADGRLVRFNAADATFTPLTVGGAPPEPDHQPWAGHQLRPRLHTSVDGRFAAVVNDHGQHGHVVDLRTGEVTLVLHGGDYRCETVPFSLAFAFAEHHGRTVVVHRTAWNRLDVSDALTGRLLTPREPTSYQRDEPRPEHYLDYFHGALRSSPGGRWLADDGWVWAPVGIPRVWDLRRWLDEYRWESEDGATLKYLCQRDYHWNTPMCWIGEDLLAVSGIGTDDVAMLDGARVFDVATGAELVTFPGPRGAFFAAGRRLFTAAPDGLEIWDPFTGHRTGTVPGFVPTAHHPGSGELASIGDAVLRRWRYTS